MNLCCPLGLFLTLVHWVLKLGGKHQEMVGLVPGRSSASVEALCRVSVTSQTSSTGLAHVETLTWPPTTEKPWQGQIGRRGWERERKFCVSVWMCVCVGFKRERTFSTYRLTAAKIKARSEPTTHLKELSAVSPLFSCQHDSFLSTPPLPPSLVSLTFLPSAHPHLAGYPTILHKNGTPEESHFLRMDGFFKKTTPLFSFVPCSHLFCVRFPIYSAVP